MPGLGLVEQLVAALSDAPSLLLLDNCEHLLEECAGLVAAVLAQHPSATVLATAREPLGVPGEITWRVRSLAAPPPEAILAVPSVSQYEAVRLFVDRARRARPSFTVSDANAPAIAQICYRLDGIPLALELAAARCRQLPVERIALDLDDRFHLLTGGARTVLPRQQTLAASIDWSYDRLDEVEQLVFRRLAVFVNLFALEGAEAVASALGDVDRVAVFDVLSRLVDKSLVVVEERLAGESHYRLLETLRAYGLDRARAAGELPALPRRSPQVLDGLAGIAGGRPPHRPGHRAHRGVPRQPGRGTRVECARPGGRADTPAVAGPSVARNRTTSRGDDCCRPAAHG